MVNDRLAGFDRHRWPMAPLLVVWLATGIPVPALARQTSEVQELERRLAVRDATIGRIQQQLQDAIQRIEVLESRAAATGATKNAAPPVEARAPSPQPESSSAGQDLDEEVGRALESTLVRRRVLLLSPWSLELTPTFSYGYQQSNSLALVNTAAGLGIATQNVRNDTFGGDLSLRLGLPWDAQAQIAIPYVDQRLRTISGGIPQSSNVSGLGDIELGLSKQLVLEHGNFPGVVGTVEWKTTSGKTAASAPLLANQGALFTANIPSLPLGTGFDSLAVGLSASKRQDPLVFYGSISYAANFANKLAGIAISPGDIWGLDIGAALAASPSTTLSADFNVAFGSEDERNGVKLRGSDQVFGIFGINAATALTPRLVLNAGLGFGVTQNAPNFILSVSLPYRF